MKVSNLLFQLIHSLSKSEKRYFNLYADLQKGDKKYVALFNILEKMETYDETVLIKKVQKKFSSKQIHVTKNYLFKLILKSLRAYYDEKSIGNRLNVLMTEAALLEQKGLYQSYFKKLQSAKKIAVQHEKHLVLLDILGKEVLLSLGKIKKVEMDTMAIYEEIKKVQEQFRIEQEYRQLYHQVFIWYRTENEARNKQYTEKIHQFSQHSLLTNATKATTFQSKICYFFSHALLHHILKNKTKSNSYYKEVVEVWGKYPQFVTEMSKDYKIHLSNYLNSCHMVKNYKPFPAILEKIEALPARSFDEEAEEFHNVFFLKLLYIMNTKQFEKGIPLIRQIEAGIEKYKSKLSKAREITFQYNIAIYYFITEKYAHSLDWTNKILQNNGIEHRKDVQLFVRVFQLLIHFELKDYLLIDNLYQSIYKKLNAIDLSEKFEKIVLFKINKLQKSTTKKQEKIILTNLKEELLTIQNQTDYKPITGMKEIMLWLDYKLSGKKMIDLL